MAATVTKLDPRYPTLYRGRNARFPAQASESVSRIEVCENATDAAEALQRVVGAGLRPTVRSGGHCYEDFVANNPNGAILDVSLLNHTSAAPGGKGPYQVGPGAVLGAVYTELYKKYDVTIPGGSCYSVASGGHLSGGGYGLLTRLQGLSVDWITAMDVLTVEANGKVVNRHVDKTHDADLFRALRGAGGASFGLITSFYFDELPPAPRSLSTAGVSFPWDAMTEDKFIHIAQTFGGYCEKRGQEPDTWPLFTSIGLTHKGSGRRITVAAALHDIDGSNDLSIATEFLDLFLKCGDADAIVDPAVSAHQQTQSSREAMEVTPCVAGQHRFTTRPWLDATIGNGGGNGTSGMVRAKYKSCYMKKNFTTEELRRIYKHLTRDPDGIAVGGVISVDSYGGASNKAALAESTAIPQRASTMKAQFQMYWQDPKEDEARLRYYDEMYTDIYSANVAEEKYAGTPFHNEWYEGCYINYPDVDMVKYTFWPELYYGTGGLYPFLQEVKRKYDPGNIFHHSMAVRI